MIYKCTYPGCTNIIEFTEHGNLTSSGGEYRLNLETGDAPRHKHDLVFIEMRVPIEIGSMCISEKDFNKQKRVTGSIE